MPRDYDRDEHDRDRDYDEGRDRDHDRGDRDDRGDRGDERRDWDDDREPRRKKSSSGKVLWIVGGIGCLILLVCGGILGVIGYFAWPMVQKMKPASEAADHFLQLLQENKIDAAYKNTSKDYHLRTSAEQFAEYIKRFELFTKHTSREVQSANFIQNQNNKLQIVIGVVLRSPNSSMTCTLIMVEDPDGWKVDSLSAS